MGSCCRRAIITTEIQTEPLNTQDLKTSIITLKESSSRRDQYNLVYNELICQVCQENLKKPMMLPCLRHSVCSSCAESLWKIWLKEGQYLICPVCGENSGKMPIKNEDFIKPNTELENIIIAYEKERSMWYLEKKNLENLLSVYKLDEASNNVHELVEFNMLQDKLNKLNKKQIIDFVGKILDIISKKRQGWIEDIRKLIEELGDNVIMIDEGKGKEEMEEEVNKNMNENMNTTMMTSPNIINATITRKNQKKNGKSGKVKKKSPNNDNEMLEFMKENGINMKYIRKKVKKNSKAVDEQRENLLPTTDMITFMQTTNITDISAGEKRPKVELKQHYFTIPKFNIDDKEIPETEIYITNYSNRLFIIITQANKLGTFMKGTCESELMASITNKTYDVKTIFGSNDRPSYEIYCRNIIEIMNNNDWFINAAKDIGMIPTSKSMRSPLSDKPLLLSLNLAKFEDEKIEIKVFKVIVEKIKQNLIYVV